MSEGLKNIKILYVEDDLSVRSALSAIIKRRVETLITAEDGEDGYKKYLEHLPDIIITDIKMPIMDGIEMSKKIREHSKNIPIIITTAFSDTEFLLEAINTGINRFVLKPVDSRKLFESLERAAKEITYEAKLEKSHAELSKNLKILTEYKNAVEAGAMASITDPKGIIISVNDEFCDFTGYSKDELIGKTHEIIRHKDFNLETEKKIAQAKEKKEIFKGLLKGRKKAVRIFMSILPSFQYLTKIIP
ncbi:MAG: hypothetical protein QG567_2369 [Campylobacterota bacterium]|nr:hypothetical protein [Campylobacterota bacterium]